MSRHNEIAEPGPTREGLLTLADTLAGLGVDVPDAEAFLERVLMPLPDAPTPPASLLRATDAELGAYAREVALHRTLADRERGVMADLASSVCVEFAGVLRAHADAIVDQLRPAFEDAITYARELAELGVTEDDTPATLITRDPQVIAAWNEFRHVHAPTLEEIAGARIDLTRYAGVQPVALRPINGPRDYALCFAVAQYDRTGEEPWQRWVRLKGARLVPPSHITGVQQLQSSGLVNAELVEAIARDRHARRTQEES